MSKASNISPCWHSLSVITSLVWERELLCKQNCLTNLFHYCYTTYSVTTSSITLVSIQLIEIKSDLYFLSQRHNINILMFSRYRVYHVHHLSSLYNHANICYLALHLHLFVWQKFLSKIIYKWGTIQATKHYNQSVAVDIFGIGHHLVKKQVLSLAHLQIP